MATQATVIVSSPMDHHTLAGAHFAAAHDCRWVIFRFQAAFYQTRFTYFMLWISRRKFQFQESSKTGKKMSKFVKCQSSQIKRQSLTSRPDLVKAFEDFDPGETQS